MNPGVPPISPEQKKLELMDWELEESGNSEDLCFDWRFAISFRAKRGF